MGDPPANGGPLLVPERRNVSAGLLPSTALRLRLALRLPRMKYRFLPSSVHAGMSPSGSVAKRVLVSRTTSTSHSSREERPSWLGRHRETRVASGDSVAP